jgi:rhamnogalacturonyl hydrolase YesR
MKTIFAALVFFAVNFQLRAQPAGIPFSPAHQDTLTADIPPEIKPIAILNVMQRVADWQLANPSKHRPTDWTQGAGDAGFMALAGISSNPKYRDAMLAMGETNHWKLGLRKYMADDQCVGQTYAELYLLYRDPKMIAPMRKKFDWILAHPSAVTNLTFRQPHVTELWSWCDSLFMAPPAWVRLYAATGDERYLNFAVSNFWRTTDFLYDTNEHLFFRDSTYFDKREANGQKIFWSRGNGWVIAGIVRILQYLPMNDPNRPRFEKLFKEMAAKILSCQQPDGLWRSSLLDPKDFPLKETSGSGFFTYALAWGVNQDLLDRAKFEPAVHKAWAALVGCVNADGKLTHVQPIGGDPQKFAPDSTEIYGVGAFLLAGSEMYRMAVLEKPANSDMVIPVIQFMDVPLTVAIENLARQAKINYILDPKIGYGQPDANGKIKPEPLISLHWTNITARQALKAILDNYGLQMTPDPDSASVRVAERNSNLPPVKNDQGSSPIAVSVKNPSSFRRDCETVEITAGNIFTTDKNPFERMRDIAVMDGTSSRILYSQTYLESEKSTALFTVDHAGHLRPSDKDRKYFQRKLLFQVDLAPHETRTFYILDASALAAVPPPIVKTFARFVPERDDDFAWESDRIAHRVYGPALMTAPGERLTSSGVDVWVKRSRRLVMDEMYRNGDYHNDHGDGMDDYRVGTSRGDGGLGVWNGKKLFVSKNFSNWKLIITGPIRSEFELTYDAWDADGRKVSETKRISIDAGSNMSRVESTFNSDDKSPLQIGVGLAERPGENVVVPDGSPAIDSWQNSTANGLVVQNQDEDWMTYWQPQDFNKGTIGVAVVLPKGSIELFTNDNPNLPASALAPPTKTVTEGQPALRDFLAVTRAGIGKPFVYYLGAGWSESGDFPDAKSWNDYVRRFAECRNAPLQVTIGN